jgi:hypothetical protein
VPVKTVWLKKTKDVSHVTTNVKLALKVKTFVKLVTTKELDLLTNAHVKTDNMKRTENVLTVTSSVLPVLITRNVLNVEETELWINVNAQKDTSNK